jgi:hypothetical protein
MSTEIEKLCDLTPVPFATAKPRMTERQVALLALLNKGITEKRPVTREEIINFYVEWSYPDGQIWENYVESNPTGGYHYKRRKVPLDLYRHRYTINPAAIQWFKSNLGACILKGKLLAIPVIEID